LKRHMAVSGVTWLHGVEGSGMAGPSDTLGSPWPLLAIRPWAISLLFLPPRHYGLKCLLFKEKMNY
jgi:hypothetical protein